MLRIFNIQFIVYQWNLYGKFSKSWIIYIPKNLVKLEQLSVQRVSENRVYVINGLVVSKIVFVYLSLSPQGKKKKKKSVSILFSLQSLVQPEQSTSWHPVESLSLSACMVWQALSARIQLQHRTTMFAFYWWVKNARRDGIV